ncbi:Asp-tRNA(Asn)/Glu-tRNA(Gln) amidotransferase subunit GatC [Patescibacteria group bacterium]
MSKKIQIDDKLLKHTAKLAKIDVSEEELESYVPQLVNIVNYVEQLEEADTKNTKPTYQVIDDQVNVLREDEIKPGLTQEEALSQATHTYNGYFIVDKVI